jgi:hypothetical protein
MVLELLTFNPPENCRFPRRRVQNLNSQPQYAALAAFFCHTASISLA